MSALSKRSCRPIPSLTLRVWVNVAWRFEGGITQKLRNLNIYIQLEQIVVRIATRNSTTISVYHLHSCECSLLFLIASDSLRAGLSGDRIPVGLRFSAPVQTGSGSYPVSYTMGTWSLPGVKRPGFGVDYPPSSSTEVEWRV